MESTLEQARPPDVGRASWRDAGLCYRPGEPVLVTIVRRERRASVTDRVTAVERAGRPPGWRAVAGRISAS